MSGGTDQGVAAEHNVTHREKQVTWTMELTTRDLISPELLADIDHVCYTNILHIKEMDEGDTQSLLNVGMSGPDVKVMLMYEPPSLVPSLCMPVCVS